jgi:Lauroyl/myristoyl acyltransferase
VRKKVPPDFVPIELSSTGDDEADIRTGVQRLAQAMEPAIRAHPEQWHLLIRLWE